MVAGLCETLMPCDGTGATHFPLVRLMYHFASLVGRLVGLGVVGAGVGFLDGVFFCTVVGHNVSRCSSLGLVIGNLLLPLVGPGLLRFPLAVQKPLLWQAQTRLRTGCGEVLGGSQPLKKIRK